MAKLNLALAAGVTLPAQAQGQQSGNAFQWGYPLALPVDGRVMLNRAAMSKWGVHLGDVTLSFIKREK